MCVCVGDGGVCCVYDGPHIEGPPQHQCKCQCHCEVWLNIVAKAKADYCESSLLPREMPSKTSDSNLADGLTQVHKQQKTQKKALPKVSRSHAQEALARRRARIVSVSSRAGFQKTVGLMVLSRCMGTTGVAWPFSMFIGGAVVLHDVMVGHFVTCNVLWNDGDLAFWEWGLEKFGSQDG